MKPRLRLAYIEESEFWDEEILRSAGRIAALYLYDERRHVFCCEMTPSHELYLVGYLTEHHVEDDIQMMMAQATEIGSVQYIHAWQVDGFTRIRRRPGFRDIDPFLIGRIPCTIAMPGAVSRDYDQAIAEMLEYLQLNGFTTT